MANVGEVHSLQVPPSDRHEKGKLQARLVDNEHHDEEFLVADGSNVPSRASFYDGANDAADRPEAGGLDSGQRQRKMGDANELASFAFRGVEDGEQESQGRFAGNYDLSKEELAKLSKDEDFMKQFRETQEGMGQRNVAPGEPETETDGRVATQNSEDRGDSDELDDGSEEEHGDNVGLYDPSEYEDLQVGAEIKDLFKHITHYKPVNVDLMTKLRPFVPDYLPAVGDIDGFIKVERPDGQQEMLGLTVVDEPCAKQSDPTVLDLQLRRMTKEKKAKEATVHNIPEGVKNTKAIDSWIESIGELHRQKPPPTVNYTGPMPDIEVLMREWPAEYEETLKKLSPPSADLDCDLKTYTDIACGLFDIPVHKSRIESLHVLFSLYSEFKNSQGLLGGMAGTRAPQSSAAAAAGVDPVLATMGTRAARNAPVAALAGAAASSSSSSSSAAAAATPEFREKNRRRKAKRNHFQETAVAATKTSTHEEGT